MDLPAGTLLELLPWLGIISPTLVHVALPNVGSASVEYWSHKDSEVWSLCPVPTTSGYSPPLISLATKASISILSNGTPSLLNDLVESNNLNNLFDDLFSIEEVKIYKPDPRVYELPIKKYKIQSDEITFLSANTWDVSGGGNFGYNSIWVNRNNLVFDILDFQPKNEINNLTQLLDIV